MFFYSLNKAYRAIEKLELHLVAGKSDLDTAPVEQVRSYVKECHDPEDLLAMARYFYLTGRHDVYIYYSSILGGIGVFESIVKRLADYESQVITDMVMKDPDVLKAGTEPKELQYFTERFMDRLKSSLECEKLQKIVAGNNHSIPAEAYSDEQKLLRKSDSLEDLMKRKVKELQDHCDQNIVW